jgi:hypothetical protein
VWLTVQSMFVVLGLFECLRASVDDLEAVCVCDGASSDDLRAHRVA